MTWTSALLLTAICVALTAVSDCQALDILTAKVGKREVLTCKDIPDEYSCVWTTPQRLTLTPTTANPDRYNIKFDKVAKTCTFTINGTIFIDTGIWECNDVAFVHLIVTATPDEPFLQFDDEKRIKDSKTMVPQSPVNLTCVSKNGHPAPSTMKWTVNGQEIQSSEYITIVKQSNDAITAKRYLSLNLDQAGGYALDNPDKEKTVTCTVKHMTGTKKVTKILGRGYLTTKVELQSSGTAIKGTDSVKLRCDADGLPVATEYKITNKATNTVVSSQQNATVTEPGKYVCQARQENGKWVDSRPLEITGENKEKPPTTIGNLTAEMESSAILPCRGPNFNVTKARTTSISTDSHFISKFDSICFWMHGSNAIFSHRQEDTPGYRILYYSSDYQQCDLIILNVKAEDHGDWQCIRPKNVRQQIHLTVPGNIDGAKPDVTAMKGATVFLPCRMRATNKLCLWVHNTTVILYSNYNPDTAGYEIVSDPEKGRCDLLIHSVQEEDQGEWYCRILGNSPLKLKLEVTMLP